MATLCTWLCGCVMYLAIWLHNVLAMLLCYVPGYVAVMYLAMWLCCVPGYVACYALGYMATLCTGLCGCVMYLAIWLAESSHFVHFVGVGHMLKNECLFQVYSQDYSITIL